MHATFVRHLLNYVINLRLFIIKISVYIKSTLPRWLFLVFFSITLSNIVNGQFTRDSVPVFDSITVDNDIDIDSNFFAVMNRWGEQITLPRSETDSVWNYWNHVPALDPSRFYFYLGNTGSPAIEARWNPHKAVGFDPGVHHLDLYRLNSDQFNYYSTGRAYTLLHYNQSPQQTKSATNVKFGRAFSKASGISIQYDRINDIGEFNHQKTRQTSVGAGLYFFPADDKKVFFSYISNNFTLEENGGITSIDFYADPNYDDRSLIPTNLNISLSELKEREARLTSIWTLGEVRDTVTNGLSILYDGKYSTLIYKYSDANTNASFYRNFSIHENGQRAFIQNNVFSNSLGVQIDYGKRTDSEFKGKLNGRIEYRWNSYTQSDRTSDINNLLLRANYAQQLSKVIQLRSNLVLALGDQAGDYLLKANAILRPFKSFHIQGHFISQLRTPTGIEQVFYSLESPIYLNNYPAASYNAIGGTISMPALGLSAKINNIISSDHVYFDEEFTPQRLSSTVNILQFQFGLKKQLHWLFTENNILIQNSSDNRIVVPTLYSKHYLGGKWQLFKKRLQLDLGASGVIIPDFDGYGYFPLTGQFYPTQTNQSFNYTMNGLLGLRVDQFNVYIKFENMQSIWDEEPRFMIQDYPMYDFRMRIGFRWLLRG